MCGCDARLSLNGCCVVQKNIFCDENFVARRPATAKQRQATAKQPRARERATKRQHILQPRRSLSRPEKK
jgi:hypothetical protein